MTETQPMDQAAFHAAMVAIYENARREVGYNATRFIQMVAEQGGLATARQLLHASTVSDGFTALWEAKRLDLTVEALVIGGRCDDLFTVDERAIARRRLQDYGFLSR